MYIDPPFNTSASEIVYKNGYLNSSWLSLISNRIPLSLPLMLNNSILCVAIDDFELPKLTQYLLECFGEEAYLSTVVVRSNPHGRAMASGFSPNHEYALFFGKTGDSTVGRIPRNEKKQARYPETDKHGAFAWMNLRKTGAGSARLDRPKLFYPIFVSGKGNIRISNMYWSDVDQKWNPSEGKTLEETAIIPIDSDKSERVWNLGWERAREEAAINLSAKQVNGEWQIYRKYRPNDEGALPSTWWEDAKYSATESGTRILKEMFGDREGFSYPKSIFLVEDCLRASHCPEDSIILDYFGGSGTTGHATISINRKDRGHRKYILVEQGEYFDTVMKPRIQKVVYSADWKDGKPTSPETGISHTFKTLKLESYEDTLNNLQLRRTEAQQKLIEALPKTASEDYLLRYMMDIESRGSLLSAEHFKKPFDCKLKVAVDSAGAYEERTIDLVETFNYLIGLKVKHIDIQRERGFVTVTGWLPTGEKTLVLWRDLEQVDYEKLNQICDKLKINPADSEYAVVYINGDHNIPAVFTSTEAEGNITKTLKIRQIEPEFISRMFDVEGV